MPTSDDQTPSQASPPNPTPNLTPNLGEPGRVRNERERELDLGIVASGNAEIDESLGVLSDLDQVPVEQHPGIYENVHEQLAGALSTFDDVEVDPDTDIDS